MSIIITNRSSSSGSSTIPVTSKTTTYTATTADGLILCSGSAFTVTLPAASGSSGTILRIKKTDASLTNIITIARAGSDLIDGNTSTTLNVQYETVTLVSDGSANWELLAREYPTTAVAYTPTIVGFGTATNINVYSVRVGQMLKIFGQFSAGTVNGSTASVSLGYQGVNGGLSTISIPSTNYQLVGKSVSTGNTGVTYFGDGNVLIQNSTNATVINFGANTATNGGNSPNTGTNTTGTGSNFQFECDVPILGWN